MRARSLQKVVAMLHIKFEGFLEQAAERENETSEVKVVGDAGLPM